MASYERSARTEVAISKFKRGWALNPPVGTRYGNYYLGRFLEEVLEMF